MAHKSIGIHTGPSTCDLEKSTDHYLITFVLLSVLPDTFYVLTLFIPYVNRRGNLYIPHKFPRCITVFCRVSQFSDPKGRRFESCQPHQKSTRLRYVGACFCCCMESVPARAALQPHHCAQLLLCLPLLLVKGMGVNVQRCTRLGMTQQAGHGADIHTLGNQ